MLVYRYIYIINTDRTLCFGKKNIKTITSATKKNKKYKKLFTQHTKSREDQNIIIGSLNYIYVWREMSGSL